MAKRPSFADIAAAAGVGTATVERVLNSRGNVSPTTAERVVLAARQLGYDRRLPERYHGVIRIEVIMVQPDSGFFERLNRAFLRIAASLETSIHVHRTFVDEKDRESLARHISEPAFRRSGLILISPDHAELRRRVSEVRAAGVPVVSIISRIGNVADAYVGIDNYAAGRAAAFYMSQFQSHRSGSLLALCHSGTYEVHRERIRGFSDYLANRADTRHEFRLAVFGHDERETTSLALRQALAEFPDCIGLYNAGGANRGVADILVRHREGEERIVWIGHELTERSRGWLKSGLMRLVLDQAPETQARRALDIILTLIGFIDVEISSDPVPFITFNSENC